MTRPLLATAVMLLFAGAALADQIKLLGSGGTLGADSVTGRKFTVVSMGGGAATISVRTEPHVNLVCRTGPDRSTCYAFVRAGARIITALTRDDPTAATPPAGAAGKQWMGDCAGQGASCLVTTDRDRTVAVDWAAQP